jgi:hypothetical protein
MNNRYAGIKSLHAYSQSLRDELLTNSSDADLEFRPGGSNKTLLELFAELGEIQGAYTRAFREFRLRFDLSAPYNLKTVADLTSWFSSLDAEMLAALEELSDADFERVVPRDTHHIPVGTLFYTFREAVLIVCAKVNIYFHALGKPIPAHNRNWIG